MKGWKDERMKGWKDERMKGRKDERKDEWKDGWKDEWTWLSIGVSWYKGLEELGVPRDRTLWGDVGGGDVTRGGGDLKWCDCKISTDELFWTRSRRLFQYNQVDFLLKLIDLI